MAASNETAAADALTDLLQVCLGSKQPYLQALLANIIAAVATGTTAEAAAAAEVPSSATAEAPNTAASEAAVSMLAAVADRLSPDWGDRPTVTGRRQQHNKVSKNAKLDLLQQQESAAHVMLAYASRGPQEQQMVLQPYFCKVTFALCFNKGVMPTCFTHVNTQVHAIGLQHTA